jgi:hypothetical protein
MTPQLETNLTVPGTGRRRLALKRKVGYEDREEENTREKLRRMQIDSDTEVGTALRDIE